jgi:hypothetical protein
MAAKKHEFTPTEDLILEVLISRYRMGENLWTFDRRLTPIISRLAKDGWVHEMSGSVENTVRASLTEKAVVRWLSFKYIPPIARGDKKMKKKFKAIYKSASKKVRVPSSTEPVTKMNTSDMWENMVKYAKDRIAALEQNEQIPYGKFVRAIAEEGGTDMMGGRRVLTHLEDQGFAVHNSGEGVRRV